MVIVGLADAALAEARERCRAAVHSKGLGWPAQREDYHSRKHHHPQCRAIHVAKRLRLGGRCQWATRRIREHPSLE